MDFREITCYYIYVYISSSSSLVFSPKAGFGDRYGSGTLHSRQFLRGRLPLLSPTFRRSHFRHERPLSAKDGITGEKWPVNFDFHVNPGFFNMLRKSATWEMPLPPPQGRHAVDFFAWKIRRLWPGSNPWSWVPEASMLTTRPPKPLTLIMRFSYLFLAYKLGRWIQHLALETRGEKLGHEGRWWHITSKVVGTCHSASLWNSILNSSYSHHSASGRLWNNPLQDILNLKL